MSLRSDLYPTRSSKTTRPDDRWRAVSVVFPSCRRRSAASESSAEEEAEEEEEEAEEEAEEEEEVALA